MILYETESIALSKTGKIWVELGLRQQDSKDLGLSRLTQTLYL